MYRRQDFKFWGILPTYGRVGIISILRVLWGDGWISIVLLVFIRYLIPHVVGNIKKAEFTRGIPSVAKLPSFYRQH